MALGKIILGMDSQSVAHRHSIMENNVYYIIIHMAGPHGRISKGKYSNLYPDLRSSASSPPLYKNTEMDTSPISI